MPSPRTAMGSVRWNSRAKTRLAERVEALSGLMMALLLQVGCPRPGAPHRGSAGSGCRRAVGCPRIGRVRYDLNPRHPLHTTRGRLQGEDDDLLDDAAE